MMPIVTNQMVQDAFDWLNENAGAAANAKALKVRAEYKVKKTKARLFLQYEGTVADRESQAITHDDYDKAIDTEVAAIEVDEWHRNQKDKCIAIIEAWRTEQANLRGMGKVG